MDILLAVLGACCLLLGGIGIGFIAANYGFKLMLDNAEQEGKLKVGHRLYSLIRLK